MPTRYDLKTIEPLVIGNCERDLEHANYVFNNISHDRFKNPEAWPVFVSYAKQFHKTGRLPSRRLLLAENSDDPKKVERINKFFNRIDELKLDEWHPQDIQDLTVTFHKKFFLKDLSDKFANMVNQEEDINLSLLNMAETELKEGLALCEFFIAKRPTDYDSDFEDFLTSVLTPDSRKIVKTGYPTLDEALRGGLPESTLTVLASRTHGGKTATMLNLAHRQVHAGYNVLFVTLEDTKKSCDYKELALRSDIPLEILEAVDMKKKRGPIAKFIKQSEENPCERGKYYIVDMSEKEFRVRDLRQIVAAIGPDNLDAIYLDYIGKVSPPKDLNSSSMYEKAKSIAAELRRLAIENKLPIITAAQTTRESMRKTIEDLDLDCISESYAIAHSADLIIILSGKEDSYRMYEHQRYLKIVKNRISDKNDEVFSMYWDMKTLKIFDDSQHDDWINYAQVTDDTREIFDLNPNGGSGTFNKPNRTKAA